MNSDDFVDADLLRDDRDEPAGGSHNRPHADPHDEPAPGSVPAEPDPTLDLGTEEMDERLRRLKREQLELEERRSEIEQLRRRRDQYDRDRQRVLADLEQGLILLEREVASGTDRLEWMHETRARFREMLERIRGIDDRSWSREELTPRLEEALRIVGDARIEHARAQERMSVMTGKAPGTAARGPDEPSDAPPPSRSPVETLQLGLALALPTAVVLAIALGILGWMLSR